MRVRDGMDIPGRKDRYGGGNKKSRSRKSNEPTAGSRMRAVHKERWGRISKGCRLR